MGSTRFEPAGQQSVRSKAFDDLDMRGRWFANFRQGCAAPAAIAAVANQPRCDRLTGQKTGDDDKVAASDRMLAELPAKFSFAKRAAGKYQQAAGFLVEAVDDPQGGQLTVAATELSGNRPLSQILQSRIERPPSLRPAQFQGVSNAVDSGRFFNNHQMLVEMPNHQPLGSSRPGQRLCSGKHGDLLSFAQPPGIIGSNGIADLDSTALNQRPNLFPGRLIFMQSGTEDFCQRLPGFSGIDEKRFQ